MQVSTNKYFLMRDSDYKLALRNLLNKVFRTDGNFNLVAYKVPESYNNLTIPRSFHYPFLKRAHFTLHRSIILSDNQREEVWYNNEENIFYCKTGELYEFYGVNTADITRLIDTLKRSILNEFIMNENKQVKVKKLYKDFYRMLGQILDYAPMVNKMDQFSINHIANEAKLIGESSCKHAAACAYVLLLNTKKFNVCVGALAKHPDFYEPKNTNCIYIEADGRKYLHDVKLKNYYGTVKQVDQDEVLKNLDIRENYILNEMKRLEFIKQSDHDPRMKRRLKYLKRKYNVVSVDESEMVNYGHFKCKVEVGNYEITVFVHKFIKTLKVYKNLLGKDVKFSYDFLRSSLPKIVDASDLRVHCSCPDFKYRFAYWASKKGYKAGVHELRPAKIRNPRNDLGSACKHVLALFSNKEWVRDTTPHIRKVVKKHPNLIP